MECDLLSKELRRAADEFVQAVAVVAYERGEDPKLLTLTAVMDAVARMNEESLPDDDDEAQ